MLTRHTLTPPHPVTLADEWADQLVRTAPLILLPYMMPSNIDLLFAQFAVLFYGYGVYLHWVRAAPCARSISPPPPPALTHSARTRPPSTPRARAPQGFDSDYISPHSSWINSSYNHYFHHAYSAGASPIYTGFFFKLWDSAVGTVNKGECVCSICEGAKGKRSQAEWQKVQRSLPDYSELLKLSFWMEADSEEKRAA